MRAACRGLIARLRRHCDNRGIKPPTIALRRFATLRWVESQWHLRDRMTVDRDETLEMLAYRLQLDRLERGTPLCGPDLPDCIHADADLAELAPWPDAPLMLGFRDMAD